MIAKRHSVPISAVATRYVLDIPSVKAVIVGTRLGSNSEEYVGENLKAFTFKLADEDRALIAKAQEGLTEIPGDCGDEYRRAPFLTAAGDLSHHIAEQDRHQLVRDAVNAGKRIEYVTGSKWEPIAVSWTQPIKYLICARSEKIWITMLMKMIRATAAPFAQATQSTSQGQQQTLLFPTLCQTWAGNRQEARPSGSSTPLKGL
jgi:hypothetical protein